jgi:hypothetical protein
MVSPKPVPQLFNLTSSLKSYPLFCFAGTRTNFIAFRAPRVRNEIRKEFAFRVGVIEKAELKKCLGAILSL